ncbi:MAG TPA: GWxTD domain-containing protein [Candidatus Krumholzibacteria bacterium]|nr:GWxTD domain-containing protein [Candidatus Krumholzibacteria bacterium]
MNRLPVRLSCSRAVQTIALVAALCLPAAAKAQTFGLFANAYLDSTRVPMTRITVEVPFRTLIFLKKEGYYDSRYEAYISIRPAGNAKALPTTYVLNGFATVKTYDETRRRDQKSRAYREIKLPPGEYAIDAQLTVRNTQIALHRSVTVRVPNFLASGIGFGTPRVMAIPQDYKKPFGRWNEVETQLADAENPPDAAVEGLEREPAVRFSVYLDHPTPGAQPCDIFYEVADLTEHQLLYGKRRVMLDGKTDDFVLAFSVDDWEPGVYRVNLRARAYSPDRDATTSVDVHVEATRAMLGANFDATLDILSIIASKQELDPLRKAPEAERPATWAKFWAARDPDPSTPENEALDAYLERVQYVTKEYSQFGPGWRSDRGRVYIKYGAPEQVDTAMDSRSQGEYEIWRYYTRNLNFVFYDMFGVGDYKLVEGEF